MRKDIVENWLTSNGYSVHDSQLLQMAQFQDMVLTAPMNLTAIKDDEGFAIKHFVDSLSILPWVEKLESGASCIDIGTGAGFPGIPLKLVCPGLNTTLLDSLLKRILFLRGVVDKLGLQGVECIHARVEDFTKAKGASYDLAIARAVAALGKLAEYALPLVMPSGIFLAMKGPDVEAEVQEAKPVIERLGAVVEAVETVEIHPGIGRSVVVVRKL